ncbi:hypothetical protein M8J77_017339 [Diaphorina citri]|nr:hypothetical protein M8J77_017339 [Diaphorina citri]
MIQSGSNQSLQFLGKIQNKGATNVLGGASATTNNNNMIDTRTVQRFKVTPGSSVMQQFANPNTGAITYQQFQIQSPVSTSPAPKRRKSTLEPGK